jgi:wyosine [tRNA(Phe)-imidazoG37] synthetase (radical SAM superfamily)
MDHLYGPVPSRRLGLSLGVSPIPKKTCNYACVYCQLGQTDHMISEPQPFFDVDDILREVDSAMDKGLKADAITIVGEGEPTLYRDLGPLIKGLKMRTDLPVAVITNGALLFKPDVRDALMEADIVLPSFDAVDAAMFKAINRPHGSLSYEVVRNGLVTFSRMYKGLLWLEIMLVKGMNDTEEALGLFKTALMDIRYDKLYLNTPVRPPAVSGIEPVTIETMERFSRELSGISIDFMADECFASGIKDDLEAIISIITRHPMNQHEIRGFLDSRACADPKDVMRRLGDDPSVEAIHYRNVVTYRMR